MDMDQANEVTAARYAYVEGQMTALTDAFMVTAESYATAMSRAAQMYPYPWEVDNFIAEVLSDAH